MEHALQERFLLKRHAYQTGDAESLRSFYADDIVIVGVAGWRCIVETLLRQDLSLVSGFAT